MGNLRTIVFRLYDPGQPTSGRYEIVPVVAAFGVSCLEAKLVEQLADKEFEFETQLNRHSYHAIIFRGSSRP